MDDDPRDRAEQRTVLMPRRDVSHELPTGHRLQEFVVQRVLGMGGYSVVYLAHDTRLDRRVALKEYLPATLAQRISTGEVVHRLPRFAQAFDKGLQGFINEARMLGSFDHPSLVKVFRFWSENGTAYMVMPYYEGITLKKWLSDLGAAPSEAWLRQLATPLADALNALHTEQCFHRDVAPDNILMLYERRGASYLEQAPHPVLLDFGAARRVIGDETQNLTAILKSGYSPVEQYDGEVSLRQGSWTDVYALCAVLYTAVTGKAPGSSIARLVRDEMASASELGRGRYSESFLAAIDAGLSVRPEQRPQTMGELLRRFDTLVPVTVPVPVPPAQAAAPLEMLAMPTLGAAQPGRPKRWGALLLLLALLLSAALGTWLLVR